MAETSTEIDPGVDMVARLYQHLVRERLGEYKSVIDPATQHCRPTWAPLFRAFILIAESERLTPRLLLDLVLRGARAVQRQTSFTLKTEHLASPSYVGWLLDAAERR